MPWSPARPKTCCEYRNTIPSIAKTEGFTQKTSNLSGRLVDRRGDGGDEGGVSGRDDERRKRKTVRD